MASSPGSEMGQSATSAWKDVKENTKDAFLQREMGQCNGISRSVAWRQLADGSVAHHARLRRAISQKVRMGGCLTKSRVGVSLGRGSRAQKKHV